MPWIFDSVLILTTKPSQRPHLFSEAWHESLANHTWLNENNLVRGRKKQLDEASKGAWGQL